jgi:hypothetical protein
MPFAHSLQYEEPSGVRIGESFKNYVLAGQVLMIDEEEEAVFESINE